MRCAVVIALALLSACSPEPEFVGNYDRFLQRIIDAFDVRPLPTKPFEETAKFKLGQALFFDPILSGNRDVSCATCHLLDRGLSDALPASIGTGGIGLAEERSLPPSRPAQPRNALDLWNRDNNSVRSMFWDGRAEVLDPVRRKFRTPLGDQLPPGFENLMAVQAIFPLTQEDEMLGLLGDDAPAFLPDPHGGRRNDLASTAAALTGTQRIKAVLDRLMLRLLGGSGQPSEPWQQTYRELFAAAYPAVDPDQFSIVHLGNALAHYEEIAFATRDAPWDRYLRGERLAISEEAKRGALLFFGKGRCAVCHYGPLFSDFAYYGIGVKNFGPGYDGTGDDVGRYRVTGNPLDRYKFRTPPLRNVTRSAPYFHNGSAATLVEAIRQHLDPYQYADKYDETGGTLMNSQQIDAISPVLAIRVRIDEVDVADLIAFLKTLEDNRMANYARVLPRSVPSGIRLGLDSISSRNSR
jgi:cytochrome c peroxidase